jgi:hypothetical protein
MTILDFGLWWHVMTSPGHLLTYAVMVVVLAGHLGQEWARDRGWTDFRATTGPNLDVRPVDCEDMGTGGALRPVSGDPAGVTRGASPSNISPWETLPPA